MANCIEKQIPAYLHTNQRPSVGLFHHNERLTHRVEKVNPTTGDSTILENGTLAASVFAKNIQGLSCNRSEFCENDDDVLFNDKTEDGNHMHDTHFVSACAHSDVANQIFVNAHDPATFFTLIPCHDPIECIYPHTEIRIFRKDEVYNEKLNIPPTVKADIRKFYTKIFKPV